MSVIELRPYVSLYLPLPKRTIAEVLSMRLSHASRSVIHTVRYFLHYLAECLNILAGYLRTFEKY